MLLAKKLMSFRLQRVLNKGITYDFHLFWYEHYITIARAIGLSAI